MRSSFILALLLAASPAQAIEIEAFGGFAYTNWTFDTSSETFGEGGVSGRYDAKVDPFVMRVLELKISGISGLDIGLNYLTSEVLGAAGISSRDDLANDDPVSAILGGDLRYPLFPWIDVAFHSELKRFDMRQRVVDAGSGTLYYPSSKAARALVTDENITLSTATRDIQVGAYLSVLGLMGLAGDDDDKKGAMSFGETAGNTFFYIYLGYRRLSYDAPIDLFVESDAALFWALPFTTNTSNLVDFSVVLDFTDTALFLEDDATEEQRIANQEGFGWFFKLSAFTGGYTLENEYFKGENGSANGLGVDTYLTYTTFMGPILATLKGGIFYNSFTTSYLDVAQEGVTLTKDMPYANGELASGSKILIETFRQERFWGPYATVSFTF